MIIRTGALVISKLRDALGMGSPEFVCLNEDYLEETIDFATRVFVKSEPLTVHLKVTMDEARPLMAAVCNAALTDKTPTPAASACRRSFPIGSCRRSGMRTTSFRERERRHSRGSLTRSA
jgi:hypothetical protein